MDRPRLICGLRIAASALVLAACVPLIALWARSCKTCDLIGRWPLYRQNVLLMSIDGRVHFFGNYETSRRGTKWISFSTDHASLQRGVFLSDKAAFRVAPGTLYLVATHWLLVALLAPIAIVPWVPWSQRFSIRALLLVATLITLTLGSILAAATNTQ